MSTKPYIEPPFTVDDRVHLKSGSPKGIIVAFTKDGKAIVDWLQGDASVLPVACLTHETTPIRISDSSNLFSPG